MDTQLKVIVPTSHVVQPCGITEALTRIGTVSVPSPPPSQVTPFSRGTALSSNTEPIIFGWW